MKKILYLSLLINFSNLLSIPVLNKVLLYAPLWGIDASNPDWYTTANCDRIDIQGLKDG